MTENKINTFNTEQLVVEIQNAVTIGLNTILKNFSSRYELLENIHRQIMSLPSVLNDLNKNFEKDTQEYKDDKTMFSIRELVREGMENIEKRLEKMEKSYDIIVPILDKILVKIQNLNQNIILFNNNTEKITIRNEDNYIKPITKQIITSSCLSSCENENIIFDIENIFIS